MPEREVSNYEKLCEFWRERFLQMNLQELKEKIPGLREDEESLRLTYFGEEYCIGKKGWFYQKTYRNRGNTKREKDEYL